MGSVIAMSDTSGNLVEGPYVYDPYGGCRSGASACGAGVPFRFTGQRFDPESNTYYYRARNYSAVIGRFLQTDPVGHKDDLDAYTYVHNDPTDGADPMGLSCTADDAGKVKDCSFDEIKGGGAATPQMNTYLASEKTAIQTLQSGDQNRSVSVVVDGKTMSTTAGEAARTMMGRYTVADPGDKGPHGGHTDIVNGKTISTITARGLAGDPGKSTPVAFNGLTQQIDPAKTQEWNRQISAVHELGFHGSAAERSAFGPVGKEGDNFNSDHQGSYNQGAEDLLGLPHNPYGD